MIEARDVCVSLSGKPILSDVNFAAEAGEVTAIIGPNGSGKSTLLKAMAGELPYRGAICLAGDDVSALKPWVAAARRAVLPQATALSFPFTVREVVRLGLLGGRSGVPLHEQDRLPERALAKVDLAGFAGRFYQELSGGEQQRVQLARVLCQLWAPVLDGQARCLMLDEPVSSLDIRHQLVIMDVARNFARQGGAAVVILHDLNLTSMYADQIYLMHRGHVAASGAPAEVLRDDILSDVFECALQVGVTPPAGAPFVLPQSAA
jgi:iron complex transport system ATP-binding protein